MFYKINNKYYIKMKNYYKELEFIDKSLVPVKDTNKIIEDMSVLATPISYEDILKEKEISFVPQETTFKHKKRK